MKKLTHILYIAWIALLIIMIFGLLSEIKTMQSNIDYLIECDLKEIKD